MKMEKKDFNISSWENNITNNIISPSCSFLDNGGTFNKLNWDESKQAFDVMVLRNLVVFIQ